MKLPESEKQGRTFDNKWWTTRLCVLGVWLGLAYASWDYTVFGYYNDDAAYWLEAKWFAETWQILPLHDYLPGWPIAFSSILWFWPDPLPVRLLNFALITLTGFGLWEIAEKHTRQTLDGLIVGCAYLLNPVAATYSGSIMADFFANFISVFGIILVESYPFCAGLALGFAAIVRAVCGLMAIGVVLGLALQKRWRSMAWFTLGGVTMLPIAVPILQAYVKAAWDLPKAQQVRDFKWMTVFSNDFLVIQDGRISALIMLPLLLLVFLQIFRSRLKDWDLVEFQIPFTIALHISWSVVTGRYYLLIWSCLIGLALRAFSEPRSKRWVQGYCIALIAISFWGAIRVAKEPRPTASERLEPFKILTNSSQSSDRVLTGQSWAVLSLCERKPVVPYISATQPFLGILTQICQMKTRWIFVFQKGEDQLKLPVKLDLWYRNSPLFECIYRSQTATIYRFKGDWDQLLPMLNQLRQPDTDVLTSAARTAAMSPELDIPDAWCLEFRNTLKKRGLNEQERKTLSEVWARYPGDLALAELLFDELQRQNLTAEAHAVAERALKICNDNSHWMPQITKFQQNTAKSGTN